jgi:hypothetical protein
MKKDSKMSQQIKTIMQEEIEAQTQTSLRKFADWLMEGMSKDGDTTISHATIVNWQNGKPPATDFLEDLLVVYPVSDRRFLFALRMLAAKSPHIWGEDGIVWSLKERIKAT